ncbi:MAG: hypothetical protein JJT96_05195 [Opitutales bacterium]|nr:hypothetical protein [Opitutales bacterium]
MTLAGPRGLVCVFLSLLSLPGLLRADFEAFFSAGNVAYAEGRYAEAVEAYEHALTYGHSYGVHFNLGNAFFRLGEVGPAKLHYLRADHLRPGDPDIAANLAIVRQSARLPAPPAEGPLRTLQRGLPPRAWMWTALGGLWATAAFLFLVPTFTRSRALPRVAAVLSAVVAVTALLALFEERRGAAVGIILADETPLRVAPTSGSPRAVELRAGERVQLREFRDPFWNVRGTGGQSGFVHHTEVGAVLPR